MPKSERENSGTSKAILTITGPWTQGANPMQVIQLLPMIHDSYFDRMAVEETRQQYDARIADASGELKEKVAQQRRESLWLIKRKARVIRANKSGPALEKKQGAKSKCSKYNYNTTAIRWARYLCVWVGKEAGQQPHSVETEVSWNHRWRLHQPFSHHKCTNQKSYMM